MSRLGGHQNHLPRAIRGVAVEYFARLRELDKPTVLVTAGLILMFIVLFAFRAQAAIATLVPNADVTAGWTPSAGTTHYTLVDDGTTPNTADYISTGTSVASVTETFDLATQTYLSTASQIVLKVHAKSNTNAAGGTLDTLSINLLGSGATQTAVTCTPAYNVWADCTATFTGSWTQANVDSMQVTITKNTLGSGSPTSQRDNIFVANIYGSLSYTPEVRIDQSAYRFYENTDSANVGSPLAPQNTAITVTPNKKFRLRMALGVSINDLSATRKWTKISSGEVHTCAIASDNQAYCWGANASGQLGNGNTGTDSNVPVAVSTSGVLAGKTIAAIATRNDHSCAVASDNQVYCWGGNANGQLGNGNTGTNSNVPVAVSTSGVLAGKTILSISAGQNYSCAIASDNQAYCWGVNGSGQLGNGNNTNSNVPVAVSTSGVLAGKTILSISAGNSHTCAIASDNQAYCWGVNPSGQLGNGNTGTNSNVPVAVSTSGVLAGKTIIGLASGTNDTCAIASDNLVYCWGSNSTGQLGNGNTGTNSNVPVAVSTNGVLAGKTVISIHMGANHTCAIASDNQAYCWGANASGQLGNGNTGTDSNVPVAVSTNGVLAGKTVQSISGGMSHACAIASDNQAYCWGYNTSGQLGNASTTDSNIPLKVFSGSFILQYKQSITGSCDASGSYEAVTFTTPVRYQDNPSPVDSSDLSLNANDPTNGLTRVNQTYEERDDAIIKTAIPAGQDGMWDFSLRYVASSSLSNKPYCLRMILADGAQLTTYSSIPTINTFIEDELVQSDYRLFGEADSLTPGSPLAARNTSATLGGSGAGFRLRASVELGALRFSQISSSSTHTCALGSDNQAYCWGSNGSGQLGNGNNISSNVPVAVSTSGVLAGKTVLSISVGSNRTCAIASDNQAYCWGYNNIGQLGNGNTGTNSSVPVAVSTSGVLAGKTVQNISVGGNHACAIASDNQAYCWGGNAYGQLGNGNTGTDSNVPVAVSTSGVLAGKTILSIAAGIWHTCAIASDNQAYCWGYNDSGQLGNGNTGTDSNVPVVVSTSGVLAGKTVLSISEGTSHTCAIASDNLAYCWGLNSSGQIGNGNITASNVPVAVSTSGVLAGKTVLSITGGIWHTCAIASDNQAYCWGNNTQGQFGDGNIGVNSYYPVAVSTSGVLTGKTILSISSGQTHLCAIASDNQAYCWGSNTYGQLGNGNTGTRSSVPVTVTDNGMLAGKTVLSFSAGANHTCAIASDNQAYCWGHHNGGALGSGDGNTTYFNVPVAVSTSGVLAGKTVLSISAGGAGTCALASDSQAYCWGSNTYGQLGNANTGTNSNVPVAISTSGVLAGKTVLSISSGTNHTCAIASDNQVYCWGSNASGQLGNGNTGTDSNVPVAVSTSGVLAGKTALSISAGANHTCVLASDNQAYCWGVNGSGQLGNANTGTNSNVPVAISTSGVLAGKTVLSISSGTNHTCAIASDNLAYCWGLNSSGQIGNGNTTASNVPVAISTSGVLAGKTVLSISAGANHTCVLASDNQAYCWGYNGSGQLGNGNTGTNSNVPVAISTSGVLAGKTVLSISAGANYTCVLASDNQAYCWGYNGSGQLGNGTLASSNVPGALFKKVRSISILASALNLKLQFTLKTQPFCSMQESFMDVSSLTAIAYKDNASVANQAIISGTVNDPTVGWVASNQSYHETTGTITNPNQFGGEEKALWDFSLRDNNADAGATYCLRIVGANGSLGLYRYNPEITIATSGGGVVTPATEQQLRGGQSVIDGIKRAFIW